MSDVHANFAVSTVATAPSPATSGSSLVVHAGDGALFPVAPFNVTIWPAGAQPTSTNAEICRCTVLSTDTMTITRIQESTSARSIVIGDQIAQTVTAKSLDDKPDLGETSTTAYRGDRGKQSYDRVIDATDVAYGLSTGGTAAANITALNAAVSAARSAKKPLHLPTGAYNIAGPWQITAWPGMQIYGDGVGCTVLTNTSIGAANGVEVIGLPAGGKAWDARLADFELIGNAASGHGLLVGSTTTYLGPLAIERVKSMLNGGAGFAFTGTIDQVRLEDAVARENVGDGYLTTGVTDVFISELTLANCHGNSNGGRGAYITGGIGTVSFLSGEYGQNVSFDVEATSGAISMTGTYFERSGALNTPFMQFGSSSMSGGVHLTSVRLHDMTDDGIPDAINIRLSIGNMVIDSIKAELKAGNCLVKDGTTAAGGTHIQFRNPYMYPTDTYLRRLQNGTKINVGNGGPTTYRPTTGLMGGEQYFDTTLEHVVIWDGTSSWLDPASASVPAGGSDGEVLTKVSSTPAWAAAPTSAMASHAQYAVEDEFIGGLATSGNIGSLGWAFAGTGATVAQKAGPVSHPGLITLGSGATANTVGRLIPQVFTGSIMRLEDMAYYCAIVRPLSGTAVMSARFGFTDTQPLAGETGKGVYWSFMSTTDAYWASITRDAAGVTRNATTVLYEEAKWYLLEIIKNGATWDFYLNGTLAFNHTTNILAAGIQPVLCIETNETVTKTIDIDYFAMKTINPLAQRWT